MEKRFGQLQTSFFVALQATSLQFTVGLYDALYEDYDLSVSRMFSFGSLQDKVVQKFEGNNKSRQSVLQQSFTTVDPSL